MSERHVLVTGGAGFIGGHLATTFDDTANITTYDTSIPPSYRLPERVETVEADVRDVTAVNYPCLLAAFGGSLRQG